MSRRDFLEQRFIILLSLLAVLTIRGRISIPMDRSGALRFIVFCRFRPLHYPRT
jgi:hypothetical protein